MRNVNYKKVNILLPSNNRTVVQTKFTSDLKKKRFLFKFIAISIFLNIFIYKKTFSSSSI